MPKSKIHLIAPKKLLIDIRLLIEKAKLRTIQSINSELVVLYWFVGRRIKTEILKNKKASYGEQILSTLSTKLVPDHGAGFGERNLFRMVRFYEVYSDIKLVRGLSQRLGWSHFVELISIKDALKRDYYAEICRVEQWSVRTLRQKLSTMLFERTAFSRKPTFLAKSEVMGLRKDDRMTPDLVFRDPYFLDFLHLKDTYSEKDLEDAIIYDMQKFLTEMGTDFSFIARQKRISIGPNDYYLDLLFYHRRLRCLTAIELKLGKFKPADMGQMELYLRWLDKYEKRIGENNPVGLILCGEAHHEEIELLKLDRRGIRVSEYLTQLPDRTLLEKKLHESIQYARQKFLK